MEDFIQQLLNEQGVPSDMDPETRTQLVSELTNQATDFINHRLIDAMSDEAVEQFGALLDDPSADPARVQDFIATHVSDKEQVVARALAEFRALYLGDKA